MPKIVYDPKNDFYQLLGVGMDADADILQRAYRQKAKEFHPDLNLERQDWAKAQFQKVNEAYSVLSDTELRQEYNNARWRANFGKIPPPPRGFTDEPDSAWGEAPRSSDNETWYQRTAYTNYNPGNALAERGAWLEVVRLGALRPVYVGLANLLGSPYRYILFFVAVLVMINLIFIVAGMAYTDFFNAPKDEGEIIVEPTITLAVDQTPNSIGGVIPTLEFDLPVQAVAELGCIANLHFSIPGNAKIGQGDFTRLTGTVNPPNLTGYRVTAQYLGIDRNSKTSFGEYVLRETTGALDAPVEEGFLATFTSLEISGFYRVNLIATVSDRETPLVCAVILEK